jgi:hypothetical protein
MNLAYIVNEYLKALGWEQLTVTENVEPVEMLRQWTVYANKKKIGEFETELRSDEPIKSFIANTAINMFADYEKKKR